MRLGRHVEVEVILNSPSSIWLSEIYLAEAEHRLADRAQGGGRRRFVWLWHILRIRRDSATRRYCR